MTAAKNYMFMYKLKLML